MTKLCTAYCFAPAKINLILAILGARKDGFHNIWSLVAQLNFGDMLSVKLIDAPKDQLLCSDKNLPSDETNLALLAVKKFRSIVKDLPAVRVKLNKNIPSGAGLGGGSSDAVAVLKCLNSLQKNKLTQQQLNEIAASIGSDCPLFLSKSISIIEQKGEIVSQAPENIQKLIESKEFLIFKPNFCISTKEAYAQIRKNKDYVTQDILKKILDNLNNGSIDFFNSFQSYAWEQVDALQAIGKCTKEKFGLETYLSGSGSACFVVLAGKNDANKVKSYLIDKLKCKLTFIKAKALNVTCKAP